MMGLQLSKKHVWLACIIILSSLSITTCLPIQSNTPLSGIVVCIYRISGSYGAFARFVYYSALLFSTLFRQNEWIAGGIMATAMLSSSVAILHGLVLLCINGLNPKIIDLDIIPITTITVSTTFFFGAIRDYCTTLRTSSARDILYIWSVWLCIGCMICCAATWNLQYGPRRNRSSEVACYGNSTDAKTFARVMLRAASQLESTKFQFNCTNDCFSSHTSRLRGDDEIRVIRYDDLHTTYLALLPFFAMAAVIRDYILLAVRWQLSRLLRTTTWRPYNEESAIESAMFFVWLSKQAARKALSYPMLKELSAYWTGMERRWTKNIMRDPDVIYLLQKFFHPSLARVPRNLNTMLERSVNAMNHIIVVCPGLAVIIASEVVLLRRESLLRSEDFRAVGQWSVLVCAFLLGCITNWIGRY